MILKDVASGFRLGVVLPKKSFLKAPLKRMIVEFRARSGNDMRVLKADGDGSYVSNDFKAVLSDMLIHINYSGAHDHRQNGLAEQEVRVAKKDLRVNCAHSGAPNDMWGELFHYRNFTRNNLRSVFYKGEWITPTMRMENKKKPFNLNLLMPFGVKCVVSIIKENRVPPQSVEQISGWTGYFVGYGATSGHEGCYRVFNPVTKGIRAVSYNFCTIDEDEFP